MLPLGNFYPFEETLHANEALGILEETVSHVLVWSIAKRPKRLSGVGSKSYQISGVLLLSKLKPVRSADRADRGVSISDNQQSGCCSQGVGKQAVVLSLYDSSPRPVFVLVKLRGWLADWLAD